jgi:prevent-host-death family protein
MSMRTVTASEANRVFSQVLREVAGGGTVVVTSHGRPVAKIVPIVEDRDRKKALAAMLDRLRGEPTLNLSPETREQIYERDR